MQYLSALGPGVVTGAADDDPSGIATYSIAGAQLGTAMLWTALLTWPLMAVVQITCARVGMVTGEGLTRALRKKFPQSLLIVAALSLFAANTINIGADLGGMVDAAVDMTGGSRILFGLVFAAGLVLGTVLFSYVHFAAVLKWLVISLFAYVLTAFITKPDWSSVWHDLFIPSWPKGASGWSTLVAILGTTISPYLFFWQSSAEVEEKKCRGHASVQSRVGATRRELTDRWMDVGTGTFFSNLVMFFVILTCATTLHRHGITQIESSSQAAQALTPLVGKYATIFYTLGILGTGALAIPTLAGSTAYVFAETFGWHQGLNERYSKATKFYALVIASIAGGLAIAYSPINPLKALFWTAVINGLLSPVLLVGLFVVARDHVLMHGQPSSRISLGIVALTAVVMAGAAIGMFVF